MTRQHLIFDADDTLWENNIYFEHAFDDFCEFLNHSSMTPAEIRAALDEIEIANNRIHGYGALNFGHNLSHCYQRLAERGVADGDLDVVMSYARRILECPMELIEGVAETIPVLAESHELTIFTKGHSEEQTLKIDRSGLRPWFQHCEIVKEKNEEAYLLLAKDRGFNLRDTWMIGNSPKSDVNPALAAGMRAVYVPHPRTWGLEQEPVDESHPCLVTVERFTSLKALFA